MPTHLLVRPVLLAFVDCCCRWLVENPKGAVAVAAINALTTLIQSSGASTIMELEILLKAAQEKLQDVNFEGQRSKVIQLTAACK